MAEAFSRGPTVREATKKSLVVREKRSPQVPIASVARVTRVTATMPGTPERSGLTVASPLDLGHQVREVVLVPLGPAHERPARA